MTPVRSWKAAKSAVSASMRVFLSDVGHGVLEVSHNSLALLGLIVVAVLVFAWGRPDLRDTVETQALQWLQERREARDTSNAPEVAALTLPVELGAVDRATAADPSELSRQQAAVAHWLARRYRVAPEPVSRLVQEAWEVGRIASLEPTLILAIMAIESGFNPFAQSPVGAQGLMQVMTSVHDQKYEQFGGTHAAFDPVTNVRVGVQVLKECIARAGSLEGGLKFYVGAANLTDDGGYAAKVLAEQGFLRQVAAGRTVPLMARLPAATASAAPAGASAPTAPVASEVPPAPADVPADAAKAARAGKTVEQIALAR